MSEKVVRITAADSGASAAIAVETGFNCYSWVAPFEGESMGEKRELLWAEPGFEAGDKSPSRSGIPLLAPFPGRIAGAVYEWEGKRYEMEDTSGAGHAIHGFAPRAAWRVTDQSADRVKAEFRPSVDAPTAVAQWPGDYALSATYSIVGSQLKLEVKATNLSENAIPFGFGTHAYFRLPLADGADPEATLVRAPIDGLWETNELIPTGSVSPVPADDALPAGAALAGREFDTPYRFVDGATATEISEPSSGRMIRQSFDDSMKCCVIYTPGHREAICLEPYSNVPDPFALATRGIDTGLQTIEPQGTYETHLLLEAATR